MEKYLSMKILVLTVLLAGSALAEISDDGHYVTLQDDFDFTSVSTEELRQMANCLNYDGPCDDWKAMESYRQYYPEAVVDACGKCNSVQKQGARVFYDRLMNELPQEFENFLNKYDPDRKYFEKFYNSLE